jgi:hypothetical protein
MEKESRGMIVESFVVEGKQQLQFWQEQRGSEREGAASIPHLPTAESNINEASI